MSTGYLSFKNLQKMNTPFFCLYVNGYVNPNQYLSKFSKVCQSNLKYEKGDGGGGALVKSVGPASGRLSVRIPDATDLSRKNR